MNILPQDIWSNFKTSSVEPNIAVQQSIFVDGIYKTTFVFTAMNENNSPLLVDVDVYSIKPFDDINNETILVTSADYNENLSSEFIKDLTKDGFVLAVPAFFSAVTPNTDKVNNFSLKPTETVQYIYAVIAKRAVSALKSMFQNAKLIYIGMGDMAEIFVIASSFNTDISAVAIINGSAYREYIDRPKFRTKDEFALDSNLISWLSSTASVAYAKFISIPVFLALGSNSKKADIDRVQNFSALFKDNNFSSVFSTGATEYICNTSYTSFKVWLKSLSLNLPLINSPKAKLIKSDGLVYLEIDCDPSMVIKGVLCHYCTNEVKHTNRCYSVANSLPTSFNEYTAQINIDSSTKDVFAYAQVSYENGMSLCSSVENISIETEKIKETNISKTKVFYEPCSKKYGIIELTSNEALFEDGLNFFTTKSGAAGMRAKTNAIKIYKPVHNVSIDSNSILALDLYAFAENAKAKIAANILIDGKIKKYTTISNMLQTLDYFKSLHLSPTDFKDEKLMPLTSFVNVHSIEIYGEVGVGNVLFI